MRIYNIDVNKDFTEYITAVQNDTLRELNFRILKDREVYDLTGLTAKIYAVKLDGKQIYNNLTITDATKGLINIKLTSQMLAVPGNLRCAIRLYKNLDIITTIPFVLDVRTQDVAVDTAIESSNEYSSLTQTEARLNTALVELQTKSGQLETLYTSRLNSLEQIGLENQIENSNFQFGSDNWINYQSTTTISDINGSTAMLVRANSTSNFGIQYNKKDLTLTAGVNYSISWEMQSSSNVSATEMIYNYLMNTNGTVNNKIISGLPNYSFKTVPINSTTYRCIIAFTSDIDYSNFGLLIGCQKSGIVAGTTGFKIDKVELSQGLTSPSYVHSFKDTLKEVDNRIATSKTTIENNIATKVTTNNLQVNTNISVGAITLTPNSTSLNVAGGNLYVGGKLVETNIGEITTFTGDTSAQTIKEMYQGSGNYLVFANDYFTKADASDVIIRDFIIPARYSSIDFYTLQAQSVDNQGQANALFCATDIVKCVKQSNGKHNITIQMKNISTTAGVVYLNISFIARK